MKQLTTFLRQNRVFFLTFLCLFSTSALYLATISKADSFIALNPFHSLPLHIFFVNYTFFGDGIFTLAFCAFLFFRKQKKLALYILLAYLSSGITGQLIKNLIYAPRPGLYFESSQYLYRLDNFGNSGHGINSFPSGHTTSAFSLATVLAIHYKKKLLSLLLIAGALLVGYSRIYLAQHFPLDVLAGAFLGLVFATVSVVLIGGNFKINLPKKIKGWLPGWKSKHAEADKYLTYADEYF